MDPGAPRANPSPALRPACRRVPRLDIALRIGPLVLVVALFALLASVVLYAWTGLTAGSTAMPTEGYIALIAGVTVSVVVGVGLMALVFYSSRHGYDDLPKRDDEPE